MSALRTVAILGVGRAGLQHARAAAAVGLKVCAYTSLTAHSERAHAFATEFPDARWFSLNDAELLTAADLLVVALPPDIAHDSVPLLVKHGRRLLVEKPLALSTSRIEEIAQIATQSGCEVTVGYNRRLYPAIRRLREVLMTDPPRTAEVTIVEDLDFIKRSKGAALTGGYLRHGASTHMLDLSLFLFGRSQARAVRAGLSNLDSSFVDYQFESVRDEGVLVSTTIDAGDRSRRGIRVVTSSGRALQLAPLEHLRIKAANDSGLASPEMTEDESHYPESYRESFRDQLRCIVDNQFQHLHTIKDSLNLSKLVDALEIASKELRHG